MITYEQYMNKEFTHRQYYAEFVTEQVMDIVVDYIGMTNITTSIEDNFRDIPLQKWDNATNSILSLSDGLLNAKGSSKTLSIGVCIAKAAARRIRGF